MAEPSRNFLLRKRTWLVGAMAAGVMIGARFPHLWKGLGTGWGLGTPGSGDSASTTGDSSESSSEDQAGSTSDVLASLPAAEPLPAPETIEFITVLIQERSFSLRSAGETEPIEIAEILDLVKRAVGDADGIRLRIVRDPSSRPSAETALQSALAEAGISEHEVLWVPTAAE